MKRLRLQRDKGRATGLVAVLARVSGFDAVRRQLRRHQDNRRHDRFVDELRALDQPQAQVRRELQRRHEAQGLDMDRRRRALALVEARELKSLETDLLKQRRVSERARGGGNRMPALTLELRPPGRRDVAWRAKNRHPSRIALEETERTPPETPRSPESLREQFTRAAEGDSGRGGGGSAAGSSGGGDPPGPTKPEGPSRKPRKRDRDRDDWER